MIRTSKEYNFFVCRIFQQESCSAIDDNDDLLRKRFRWIDKNSSIGAIEVQLLQKALNSDAGEDIVKLYEIYETDTAVYLVMELLSGGELFDRLMAQPGIF